MEQTKDLQTILDTLRNTGAIRDQEMQSKAVCGSARQLEAPGVVDFSSPHHERSQRHSSHALLRPLKTFVKPFMAIRGLLGELSPQGLAERDIPFTQTLKLPISVVFASIIINLFGLALPLVILQVYDRIIPNQAMETFTIMMIALGVIVLFEAALRIARGYVLGWAATRFSAAIAQELVSRFLSASCKTLNRVPQSKMMERLSNINKVADFYGGQIRLTAIDLPFTVIFLGVLALIGGWLVVVPCVTLGLFGCATLSSGRYYKNILEKKEEQQARIYDFVAESLQGILTMKSQSAEPLLMRRFERLQEQNAQLNYMSITTAIQAQSFASLLGNSTMVAMVAIGAYFAIQGHITIGALACCSLLSGRAIQPVLRVASAWNDFQRARIAINEISDLFQLKPVCCLAAVDKEPPPPKVVAEHVMPTVNEDDHPLSVVSFEIAPGEVIALTGSDDNVRPALLDLISGLNSPEAGSMMLDMLPAYDFRAHYQSAVRQFAPDTEVFSGTIYENLTLFGQGATAEDVRWACDMMGLTRDIDRLPQGYDTLLGQGIADAHSSGFMGRLLIARILAQKPVLWTLNEPQVALDMIGRKTFLQSINSLRGQITLVYSTNSEAFIKAADRIFHLQDGHLTIFESYSQMQTTLANHNASVLHCDMGASLNPKRVRA